MWCVVIHSRGLRAVFFLIPPKQFRIFIYGAFGLSALIGGITSLTQLAASESKCDRLDRVVYCC